MSSNQAGEFHEIVFLENPVVKKSFINQTLIDNTLCVVGSSYKGPAFVPMHISNSIDDQNVANTLNNSIGKERQNSVGHLFDDLNYYKDTQSYHALSMWHQNDGTQSSFVRVLGISDAIRSITPGFNTESITTDLYHQDENENNKFVIHSVEPDRNLPGSVNFITKKYNTKDIKINNDIVLNSFEELGFIKNDNSYDDKEFITDVIICPEGISPLFLNTDKESLGDFYSESLTASDFDNSDPRFLISKSVSDDVFPEFVLRGFDPTAGESISGSSSSRPNRSFFTIRKNNLFKPETYNSSWINIFPSKVYENGHHLYSSYYDGDSLTLKNDYKILHVKPYEQINDALKLNYNDFSENYTTAKTPWVISQSINLVTETRERLHENVINLFKFHALDDGEVGNRFRIKINLKKRGDVNSDIFAKFDLFIMEYDPRDNTFNVLESYESLDLNVNSTNYICRRIGTKRKYFDLNTKKVFEEGIYENISQYLRVEINSDIELQNLRSDLIPCGFRAYPKIKYDNVFDNNSEDVDFMPIPYYQNYLEDLPLGENNKIKNSWGVLFRHLDYNVSTKQVSFKQKSAQPNDISPHYYHTKFFKNENLEIDQTVLDESYNSIFSLEKLVIKKSLFDSDITKEDFTIFYKRSGKSLTDYNPSSTYKYEYIDFNKTSHLIGEVRHYSIYQFDETNVIDTQDFNENLVGKLSFDFFTFGGFDGVDIYDHDQRNLTAKAVSIESFKTNSITTHAFQLAKELVMDYSNCNGDIIIFPGMRELSFTRNVIDVVEDDTRFFYITNGIFNTEYTNISSYLHNIIKKDFSKYYKDKVLFDIIKYYNNALSGTEHERSLIENQFQSTSLNSLGIDSKYCMSVIGNIIINPTEINFCPQVLDPSIFAASKMSQGIRNNITNADIQYNNFSLSLINSTYLAQNNKNFELLNNNARKNLFNILYYDLTSDLISLRSENTAYRIRRSIFSKQQFIRALQYVKKSVMLDIYTNESFIPGGALFAQVASLQNIYARLKLQLTDLFSNLVDADIISYYSLDIPMIANDLAIIDMRNNIIRGSVTIKLNNIGSDDIIRLSIQNAINSFAYILNVDNSIESEILLPASGI